MDDRFGNVPTVSGQELAVQQQHAQTGMVAVEQSRAVAESQARLVVAQARPRNEITARTKILQACDRASLAQVAVYQYPRGGQAVTGPSIRLAEVAARAWGNMEYGFREVARDLEGSEVEAFAWDLESNTRAVRYFKVKHWRDTKRGGYALTDERDKYELIANMAQRRVRACILEIVPGDIIEDAVARCDKTLQAHVRGDAKKPMKEVISDIVDWFSSRCGVTVEMLEARLGHKIEATTAQEVVSLSNIANSIKDGMSTREDWFDVSGAKPKANGAAPAEPEQKPEPKAPGQDEKAEPLPELRARAKAAVEAAGLVLDDIESSVGASAKSWTRAQCEKAFEIITANTPPEE